MLFDTGCETPMMNNLDGCESLQPADNVFVCDAHGHTEQAGGVGNYRFVSDHDGCHILIEKALYDPSLVNSYMSGGTIMRKGYHFWGSGQTLYIYDQNFKLILTGRLLEDNTIDINFKPVQRATCAAVSAKARDKIAEWHDNIGHINFCRMNTFSKIYDLNLPDCSKFRCQFCMLSKIVMKPFPRSTSRTTGILQLIHTDVSGIIRIKNALNAKYFVTFRDDFSKNGFTYLMEKKSEVYSKFIEFKTWIERQTGKKIQKVRSDQGGEYTSAEFLELEKTEGIDLQNSIPRRQQQNGAAEKYGKDLVWMARTLLIAANLSPAFWPFAIACACYLLNRAPCSAIGDDIPFRVFWGFLPDITNLKKFGKEIVIRNDEPDGKFGPRGDRAILLGYSRKVKGYLAYRYRDRQIVQTRDDMCCDSDEYVLNKEERELEYTWKAELDYYEAPDFDEEDFTDEFVCPSPADDNDLNFESSRLQVNLRSFTGQDSDDLILGVEDAQPNRSNEDEQPEHEDRAIEDDEEEQPDANLNDDPNIQKIILNKKQEKEFREANPNAKLKYRRYVNGKGNDKRREFVVYSVKTPTTFKQAATSYEAEHWNEAMLRELNSLKLHDTWEVVDRKPGMKVIPGMWLYKVKYNPDLTVDKYKARYVALGNRLQEVEKAEKYAPVLRTSSFNLILTLAAKFDLEVHHVDVGTAFLNGKLTEEIYITQPPGFADPRNPNGVCRLNRAIYGLPQSGKKFNDFITDLMKTFGMKQLLSDQCVFIRGTELIVGIYVDDNICCGKGELLTKFKDWMRSKCEITDKGEISCFLSMNVVRKDGVIYANQSSYIRDLLNKYNFQNVHPVRTPMVQDLKLDDDLSPPCDREWYLGVLCSLLFVADKSRPDLCYSITRLCRYMHNPRQIHAEALKRIVRYVAGTIDLSLRFAAGEPKIECYADADFGNDLVTGKSVSGTLVYAYGNLIHWQSKRQHFVAQSTCESEILAVREGVAMTLYVKNFLLELGLLSDLIDVPVIFNDNQSAIATLIDGGCFQRNKHYQLRVAFVRDHINKRDVRVIYKQGECMLADCLTKPLAFTLFTRLVAELGLVICSI